MKQTYGDISKTISETTSKQRTDTDFVDDLQETIFNYKEIELNPLFGQNSDSIMNILLKHKPSEEGGLVAIYGFYYQMLVLIEYMIELIKGKWSFLSLEYHDDIIAGNEEENRVRFVQVKTSSKPAISVTDSNIHVYTRSKSKKEGSLKGKIRNNSWLDKIIDNAATVKDLESIIELDLVTDYTIYSTTQLNVDLYNINQRQKNVQSDDSIYNKLLSSCYDGDGNIVNYESNYGHSLGKLLGNVCFVEKPKADVYKKWLCLSLSETLGEGIRIDENDLNWLVGELLSKCSKKESGPLLFLRRDEIEEIRQALRAKAVATARPTIYKTDATELLNRVMTSILSKISDCTSKKELEYKMKEYITVLLNKVTEQNTLQSLMIRFVSGEKPLFGDNEKDYNEDISTFITTSLLLYLIHDKFTISEKYNTLLIKDAVTRSSEQIKIGFLNLGLELDIDEGVELLTKIIIKSSKEEQLEMLWRSESLYTIFHGDSITMTGPQIIEINDSIKPKVEILGTGFKSNEVTPTLTIIPAKPIKDLYVQVRKTQSLEEFITMIEEKWTTMKGK